MAGESQFYSKGSEGDPCNDQNVRGLPTEIGIGTWFLSKYPGHTGRRSFKS